MPNLTIQHTIEPAPVPGDGPFVVATRWQTSGTELALANMTLGLTTVALALDQCKIDAQALLPTYTVNKITVTTEASKP